MEMSFYKPFGEMQNFVWLLHVDDIVAQSKLSLLFYYYSQASPPDKLWLANFLTTEPF